MSRPLSGVSSLQIKIIQEIQQGSTYEAASCAAGYKYPSDLKKPAKRARCKLKKAALNEEIRHAIRQKYPELILMGPIQIPAWNPLQRLIISLRKLTKASEISPKVCFYRVGT